MNSIEKERVYSINHHARINVSGGVLSPWVLRDEDRWRYFDRDSVKELFHISHKELIAKLDKIGSLDQDMQSGEHQEIVFLLETVLKSHMLLREHAKNFSKKKK